MSLHAEALRVLAGWDPPDAEQERLRTRFVEHLTARPDGLERGCRPDHLTASTLVLSHDHEQALLTLHAKARRWFQLGGHCEPGDVSLADAAGREAREESGLSSLRLDPVPLELDEHEVAFCGADAGDGLVAHHLDVRFLAVAADGAAHQVSVESLDLRWWPVTQVPEDLGRLVRRALGRVDDDRASAQSPAWSSGGGSTRAAWDQPSR